MTGWLYKGELLSSSDIDVAKYFGFNYLITNLDNHRLYIGKKYLWSFKTSKGSKRKKKVHSRWKFYYGSCKELSLDIKRLGKSKFKREILDFYISKSGVDFNETRKLFYYDVLNAVDNYGNFIYYNSNINGKWYRASYT